VASEQQRKGRAAVAAAGGGGTGARGRVGGRAVETWATATGVTLRKRLDDDSSSSSSSSSSGGGGGSSGGESQENGLEEVSTTVAATAAAEPSAAAAQAGAVRDSGVDEAGAAPAPQERRQQEIRQRQQAAEAAALALAAEMEAASPGSARRQQIVAKPADMGSAAPARETDSQFRKGAVPTPPITPPRWRAGHGQRPTHFSPPPPQPQVCDGADCWRRARAKIAPKCSACRCEMMAAASFSGCRCVKMGPFVQAASGAEASADLMDQAVARWADVTGTVGVPSSTFLRRWRLNLTACSVCAGHRTCTRRRRRRRRRWHCRSLQVHLHHSSSARRFQRRSGHHCRNLGPRRPL
jgi:hypothetical protein